MAPFWLSGMIPLLNTSAIAGGLAASAPAFSGGSMITNACFRAKERVGAIAFLNGVASASDLAMELGAIALEAVRGAVEPYEVPEPMPETYERLRRRGRAGVAVG